jgi:hypothetical protein
MTTLRRALADPNLLGDCLPGDSWRVWRTLLIAAMGEALDDDERAIFKQFTGREHEPLQRVNELAFVVGRRGGKSRAISVLAAYLACLCDHRDALVAGEVGVVLCISLDQRVSKVILGYCAAAISNSPVLSSLFVRRTTDTIVLSNGVKLEVRPVSFRKLRGPSYVAVLGDEIAFWYTDGSYENPDDEVLAAVRPGLLTTGGPLIMASSAYARRGTLWDTFRRHYGPSGAPSVLVAKGTSKQFNPTLSQAEIDRALAADRVRNSAEYLSEFRSDIEGFVLLEVVETCVGDHREILPAAGVRYFAFVDPSGGSSDSMTLAIAHRTRKKPDRVVVVDAIREVTPPFSPQSVVDQFAALLKSYHVKRLIGDHYAGEFVREPFRAHGINYEPCAVPKSDLYRDLFPLLNSVKIVLPRHDRLVAQIVGLERRVGRSGKDSIDHAPNGHDDLANAVAGVAFAAKRGAYDTSLSWVCGDDSDEDTAAANARWRREQYWARVLPPGAPLD